MVKGKVIRAGIIGYNEGNGHPFSFSAIVNGYVDDEALWSRYPQILNYLRKREDNEFGVEGLSITHLWTPDISISKEIAKCSIIPNIVKTKEELIGLVDLILIATDEGANHRHLAEVFLDEGMKVFIDKPLCITMEDLLYFSKFLESGQLISCSGFRFHPKIAAASEKVSRSRSPVTSVAYTKLDWFKYGIHLIEPILMVHNSDIIDIQVSSSKPDSDIVRMFFSNGDLLVLIRDPRCDAFQLDVGQGEERIELIFDDNFSYFKALLKNLVSFYSGSSIFHWTETIKSINALIKANNLRLNV